MSFFAGVILGRAKRDLRTQETEVLDISGFSGLRFASPENDGLGRSAP
jgi:hypothetical protein